MSTSRDTQPDPDDFFAETRMSFGDHIEDLRRHLIHAIAGFCIAFLVSLFFGSYVLDFISAPIDRELAGYYNRRMEKAKEEFLKKARESDEFAPKRSVLNVPREFFETMLKRPLDKKVLSTDGKYVQLPTVTNPEEEANKWAKYNRELNPRQTLHSFTIMEPVLVWFKVCLITGLILGSPWIFYQIWAFIAAGLYPQEKRLVNRFLPFSVLLFLAGVLLCQFVVLPQTISALLTFNEWLGVEPELRLNDWLNFALIMPLLFGICFQTPLAMLTLERIGLATVQTYKQKWRIVLFVIAILYVIVSPTPDPWTMILFLVPMWSLYGLGILLCMLAPRKPLLDLDQTESEEMVEV